MKKTFLIFLLTFSFFIAKAQNWGGGIDQQDFNWGFGFQYISSEFKIFKKTNWRDPFENPDAPAGTKSYLTDSLMSISSPSTVGFGIGFVVNYKLGPNLDLRSTPSLAFADRIINYKYKEPAVNNTSFSTYQGKIATTAVDVPLTLKLKSDRRKDFRAYMLVGAKYSMDLGAGKKNKDEDYSMLEKLIKNKSKYASYEAGIGFDLYFEYFKMSPEIKVSHSIGDVFKHENHPYAAPIDKAILRNFTFSLFFE